MLRKIFETVLLCAVAPLVLDLPAAAATVPPAAKVCSSFAGNISPVSRCPGFNSLCYRGVPLAPVGVSADGSCHLPLGLPSQADSCNLTNSLEYINSLDGPAAGVADTLNKMQLWVSLGKVYGDVAAADRDIDQPFEFVAGSPGYYRLDRHNDTFFNNLRDVVAYAEGRGILVEVVFFAPFEGSTASDAFNSGPWSKVRNRVCVDANGNETGTASCPAASLVPAGFASTSATFQAPALPISAEGYGRNAQLRVIQWTLDDLWCYDNVIYQIANEPEGGNAGRKVVAAWHAALINKVVTVEAPRVASGRLTRRHMISANPFWANTENVVGQPERFYYLDPPALAAYTALAQLDLINGHYTELYSPKGDNGALQLIRRFGADAVARGKLLGFNETKISGIDEGARSSLPGGGVQSARAEGWEFMLNFGAFYDHWGFDATSTLGGTVRTQMRALKTFVNGLRRDQLKQSGTPGAVTQPGWVSVGNYGRHLPARNSRRFWAALQPVSGATTKQYVLYLHNSLRRCDDEALTDPGCVLMPFNGFKPVIGSYPETLTLNLAAATYTVEWISPATGVRPTGTIWLPFTLIHTGAGSCTVGGVVRTPCTVSTPANYSYDIALKITQQ